MNVKNINLTESGVNKFNEWFADVAKEGVRMDVVMLEALSIFESRVQSEESLSYELEQRCTITGRPELFILDAEDVEIELCEEDAEDD